MSERALVEGTLKLEADDVRRAVPHMAPLVRLRWVYAALYVAGIVWVVRTTGSGPPLMSSMVALACGAAFVAVVFWLPSYQARALIRGMDGDTTLSFAFHADRWSVRSKGARATHAYSAIKRWTETEHAILLYQGPRAAQIVPKRAFSAEDLEKLRGILSGHLAERPYRSLRRPASAITLFVLLTGVFVAVWILTGK